MTTNDRRPQLWVNSNRDLDGFARLLNELAERIPTQEAVNICLLVECIADHYARGFTTIKDKEIKIDLARGHGELNQLLSPSTLEKAEAFNLIDTPTVYIGWKQVERHQVARRTLWELGTATKDHLDLEEIRGIDEDTATLRSDLNEGIVHRYLVRLTEHVYTGMGKDVYTYVKADQIADLPEELTEKIYDIIAYNQDQSVYASCEIEMRPVDRAHVAEDARLQAAIPGDSDWVVHRKQDVNRLLDTFVKDSAIELPNGHPGWGDALDLSTTNAMERLERVFKSSHGTVAGLESPIITTANSADNIREKAQECRPAVFRELSL